jgi:hypothetical protein
VIQNQQFQNKVMKKASNTDNRKEEMEKFSAKLEAAGRLRRKITLFQAWLEEKVFISKWPGLGKVSARMVTVRHQLSKKI